MSRKILQILDISTTTVNTDLFNVTAINRGKDPYWVEFIQTYFNEADVEIKILSLDKIDFSKKWIVNVDINMWNWESYQGDIFENFDSIIKKELQTGNAYIILNHQCESYTKSFFDIFYSKKIEIPYNKIIYMVAAADVEREYNNFVVNNKIKKEKQFEVMFTHHVYKRINHDVDVNAFNYTPATKTKKYISLNRRWREHRVMLVSLLSNRNLIQHGFVSLGLMPEEFTEARSILIDDKMLEGFDKLQNNLPLQVDDVDLSINQFQMNSLPVTFYQHSCFSLVSSTMALSEQEPSVGFTEKEIKPILARHPFLIWNRPGALKYMQNMGFLTFDRWFNESYDKDLDDKKRLIKIIDEVERLCMLSFDEWEIILEEMKPVLNHNYNRIVKYTNEHCFFNSDLKKLLYYVS
jgi:hypothetical protein